MILLHFRYVRVILKIKYRYYKGTHVNQFHVSSSAINCLQRLVSEMIVVETCQVGRKSLLTLLKFHHIKHSRNTNSTYEEAKNWLLQKFVYRSVSCHYQTTHTRTCL